MGHNPATRRREPDIADAGTRQLRNSIGAYIRVSGKMNDGSVFYVASRGGWAIAFPLRVDGKISNQSGGDAPSNPDMLVDVLSSASLGLVGKPAFAPQD